MTSRDAFHVYDTTLRDGAQQEGLNLSVADKLTIARQLDGLGVGFIEGGWPGANPKDTEFFARAREELATEEPYAEHLVGIDRPAGHDAATYWEVLTAVGGEVDAWETTYLHVLTGDDAVFDWISGTSLLPTRTALPPQLWEPFAAELRRRLRMAYPARNGRVKLPFRRIFAVAAVTGPS